MLAVLPGHRDKQRGEEEDEEESEQDREVLRTERKKRHSNMKEVGLCGGILRRFFLTALLLVPCNDLKLNGAVCVGGSD